jgi:hypothetical protein
MLRLNTTTLHHGTALSYRRRKDEKAVKMERTGHVLEYAEVTESSASDALLDPAFPYGEELLQSLWEAGLYDAKDLRTTDGQPLEVLKAGRIQQNSGPDLRDALVRIDGQLWAGTVEIHLRASAWDAHGHQHDPAYNNVVLHAVHTHDADVRTENGTLPPTVELRHRLDPRHIALHHELMTGQGWVPCAAHIGRVDNSRTGPWLERLLIERLERRTLETEALFRQLGCDPAETFHHLLLRALGAPVNTEAFAMLAHALPLRLLLKHRADPSRLEALLFGQAGLLPEIPEEEHPRRLVEEYRILAGLHGLRPMPAAAWKFGRMRPASFPTVRLAQLAVLLAQIGPAYGDLLETDDPAVLRELLGVEATGFWNEHFNFGPATKPARKRIAEETADRLVLNAVVPFLFTMGRVRGDDALVDRAMRLLERLPAETNNITSGFEKLGLPAANAGRGQALIELKTRHCQERKCLNCHIGSHLQKVVGRVEGQP